MALHRALTTQERDLMAFAKGQGVHDHIDDIKGRRIVCPAGSELRPGCVWCGIEKQPINVEGERSDSFTFLARCTDRYTECPTWRAGR